MAFGQAIAGNWTTRYITDAFGDPDYSQPVYTTDIIGTTDFIRQRESCTLCIMVKPEQEGPIIRLFLMRNEHQNFFEDTKVYVKLANGQKFNIPCVEAKGDLRLGRNAEECWKIIDILNKGNFMMVINSSGTFDRMKCTFNFGTQTTGITNLVRR